MATFRPDPLAHLTGRLSDAPRPHHVTAPHGGGKFTSDGRVLRFPGNTIICHIDPTAEAFAALVAMQAALKQSPLADAFVFMPPSSFHMTVFQGISGDARDPGNWPDGIAPDTPLDAATHEMRDRLDDLSAPENHRIRPCNLFAGHSVTVEGADPAQEASLRDLRERLRTATGIRPPDFDTYTFHITLGYPLRWLTDDEAREVIALSDRLYPAFAQKAPEITLGRPEFTTFDDMYRFERVAWVGAAACAA